jgi:hypothetical protein
MTDFYISSHSKHRSTNYKDIKHALATKSKVSPFITGEMYPYYKIGRL